MRLMFPIVVLALASASSVHAQPELEKGFAGALRGCEEWVLNPASWSNGLAPFVAAVGLGDTMGLVDQVDPATLPPPSLRAANHYWRINSTKDAGFILVVSDQLPMCHITGGGAADLQPVVESVLSSSAFSSRWKLVKESAREGMKSSEFRSIEEPAFSVVVSRAVKAGERTDRVQVLATAMYDPKK